MQNTPQIQTAQCAPLLCPLDSCYTLLTVQGEDAADFLQGQLSCDMRTISPDRSVTAVYCNAKGRVLTALQLFNATTSESKKYYLLIPAALTERIVTRLKKYALFAKVTIQSTSSTQAQCFGYIQAHSVCDPTALHPLFSTLPTAINQCISNPSGFITLISPFPAARFFILLQPLPAKTLIQHPHWHTHPEHHWQQHNIQAGFAEITTETIGLFTAHALNFHQRQALSFNKGCYVGQEIIARTQHLGTQKRHLYRGYSDCLHLTPGDALATEAGNVVGHLVNSVAVNPHKSLLLAVVHKSAFTAASTLKIILHPTQHPDITLHITEPCGVY